MAVQRRKEADGSRSLLYSRRCRWSYAMLRERKRWFGLPSRFVLRPKETNTLRPLSRRNCSKANLPSTKLLPPVLRHLAAFAARRFTTLVSQSNFTLIYIFHFPSHQHAKPLDKNKQYSEEERWGEIRSHLKRIGTSALFLPFSLQQTRTLCSVVLQRAKAFFSLLGSLSQKILTTNNNRSTSLTNLT